MAKVKIFRLSNASALEKEVNVFLESKRIIDIRYTPFIIYDQYDQNGTPTNASIYDSILVVYEED